MFKYYLLFKHAGFSGKFSQEISKHLPQTPTKRHSIHCIEGKIDAVIGIEEYHRILLHTKNCI